MAHARICRSSQLRLDIPENPVYELGLLALPVSRNASFYPPSSFLSVST